MSTIEKKKAGKSALKEISDLLEAHMDTLDPKERTKRHLEAIQYAASLGNEPETEKPSRKNGASRPSRRTFSQKS